MAGCCCQTFLGVGGKAGSRHRLRAEQSTHRLRTRTAVRHPLCILSIKRLCTWASLGSCTLTLGQAGLALWGSLALGPGLLVPLGSPFSLGLRLTGGRGRETWQGASLWQCARHPCPPREVRAVLLHQHWAPF